MNDTEGSDRIALLVTGSVERAESWAAILDEAYVDVLVEITDSLYVEPGRSALTGVLGTPPMQFVHVLTVPREDRDRALAALLDGGWDGREGLVGQPSNGFSVSRRSALIVIAAFLGFAVLLRAVA